MPTIEINFTAVVLAALANMVIGMLWYGPLFGKKWQELMGFTRESMKSMKMTAGQAIVGGCVTALIMSYILAHDAFVWGAFFGTSVTPFVFALQLAFWIWLGYVATTQVGVVLWEGRPWKLFFLNAGNMLVSLIAMSLILTFLR
jgi:hypothetical protein